MKGLAILLSLCGMLCGGLTAVRAQADCKGPQALTEKACPGDEVSPTERELIRLVNEYRAQNNLPPVPFSAPLSLVANRRVLDLTHNVRYLTHGWSNCPYDINKESTWNCVFGAPQRLNSGYPGQGFENLFRAVNNAATPAAALDGWKKSPLHNNLLLNLDIWKDTRFDAFGVAVNGNYAALWFGSRGAGGIDLDRPVKGLGVSFSELVEGLTNILSIQKESTLGESDKWVGSSADKTLRLEIFGREKDISETSLALSVRLLKNGQLTPQSRAAVARFLKNVAEGWSDRDRWFDAALVNLTRAPKSVQTVTIRDKTIEVRNRPPGSITLQIKPAPAKRAVEIE